MVVVVVLMTLSFLMMLLATLAALFVHPMARMPGLGPHPAAD